MKTLLLFGVSLKIGTGYQVLQLALQQPLRCGCVVLVRDFYRTVKPARAGNGGWRCTNESSVKKACELAGNLQ